MARKTSVRKGDELRRMVAMLLRTRYGETAVQEEVIISGQKAADVVFTPNDLPGIRRKIAVECKNWEEPLQAKHVQARMIAELLVSLDSAPQDAGIFHLYEHFIEYVTARETKKGARARVSDQQRLTFLRGVAWWLWVEKDDGHFTYLELPAELVESIAGRRSANAEHLVRELLVGSLLDRRLPGLLEEKGSDYFYFAHKSYWEFLVCDYLLKSKLTDREVTQISSKITTQLLEFLSSAKSELINNLYQRISITPSRASIHLYELAAKSPAAALLYERDDFKTTRNQLILSCIVARQNQASLGYRDWEEYFVSVEKQGVDNFSGMIFGLIYWASTDEGASTRIVAMVCALCAVAVSKWIDKIDRREDRRELYSQIGLEKESCVKAFLSSIEIVNREGLVLNCEAFARTLVELQLVNVEDTTLELTIRSEQIAVDQLERLREMFGNMDFLPIIIRAHREYLERSEIQVDDLEDDEGE